MLSDYEFIKGHSMSFCIGLLGLAGSGKDTAAEILQRVLREQGFGFLLRYLCLNLLNLKDLIS